VQAGVREGKGTKGSERVVGKAAGDECFFIPGLADEVGSDTIPDTAGGEGVTGPLNQEASTIDAIEQILAGGRVRQYGRRQLITHLARKHGHRSRQNDVLTAALPSLSPLRLLARY
jgi:hypothetical protein